MRRTAERGFTLVEIMIVVAIIALLAAIAIPNVLRGRTTANESASIGNLRALMSSLEMYRSVNQGYAPDFNSALYGTDCAVTTAPNPDYGPPAFCLDLDAAAGATVQGYNYTYAELPASCTNAVGNMCNQFTVTAWAQTLGNTGTRSFFLNESGVIRHCTMAAGSDRADAADNTIDLGAGAC